MTGGEGECYGKPKAYLLEDIGNLPKVSEPTCSKSTSKPNTPSSYDSLLIKRLETFPHTLSGHVVLPDEIVSEILKFTKLGHSIESVARHISNGGMINCNHEPQQAFQLALETVFFILGWKTMLYSASIGTAPPSYLAIDDVMDGYPSQAYLLLKQGLSRIKLPISDFLLGFGLMLPKENICLSDEKEDCDAFEMVSIVRPTELNAKLLLDLAKIKIKWVDVLAPHLEFDKETRTLFLFRHPSFALHNLLNSRQGEGQLGGILYSCASPHEDSTQWASKADIVQFLSEVLLSYRLLFGQVKASRKTFKALRAFDGESPETHDILLPQLCSHQGSSLSTPDKEFYRLRRDFPILRSRLAVLHYQMTILKPRGWKELWRDKRDSAQWLTFWAVLVIGGSGVLLALIQVLLQGIQLGKTDSR